MEYLKKIVADTRFRYHLYEYNDQEIFVYSEASEKQAIKSAHISVEVFGADKVKVYDTKKGKVNENDDSCPAFIYGLIKSY